MPQRYPFERIRHFYIFTYMAEESLKQKTKKGLYWTFLNQLANNGLTFVVGVIMARILSPSDYGITALPVVFIAIAEIFVSGGFGAAMIRKQELTNADLSTAFYYSASVGVLCCIILFFSAPYIAVFYNQPVLTSLVRVTALTFLLMPLGTPQDIILKRKLDFKTPTRISVTARVVGSVVGISCAYLGYGLWSLVVMSIVSSLLTLILTWIVVRWLPTERWSSESFKYLWNFGNKLMASALIDKIYSNITPVIVGKFFSVAELGVYNRANSYASLPALQGTSVIQQVTFPVLSKMQDDDENLARGYRKMLKMSAFVIFPVMMLLAALAKPFIVILVTEKWIDAVLLLQLLCFSMMWYPIHAINLSLLQVKGRSDLFLKLEIWKKVLGLTVMACTLPFGLVYFVAAGIVSSFISLFINTYYTGKLINVGFLIQMKDLMPIYLLSIFVYVVVMVVSLFFDNLWLQLFVGGATGAILYMGIAICCKFSELQDVKYMLNRKI